MRLISICTTALLMPAMLFAQGEQKPSAEAVLKELKATLAKQVTDFTAERKAMLDSPEYKAARKARDNKKVRAMFNNLKSPDAVGLSKKAVKLAGNYDSEGACLLISWATVTCRDTDMVTELVGVLGKKHIKNKSLVELLENATVISRPLGLEESCSFLDRVISESPHDLAKAWAYYWRASLSKMKKSNRMIDADEYMKMAEKLAGESILADIIAGPTFKKERLQIGMIAPNIVGEDMDGVKFELNDYRGKVVVLDFWGFW